MQVEINDVIRGYDFKPMVGRADCFVEGVVVERNAIATCGYNAYKVVVTKDQFGDDVFTEAGKGSRVGEEVFIPWKVSFMEFQGRVINLSRI